ncbi:hypothetical protein [Aquibacillus sediminis]|uniref:hypothetical protein n=1 Tax=Aquibacillus sediminis TaxID=2574734 RepID=UPI0011088775|nr:hypothetical protein [Aquibacillus sediminis]
MFYRQDHYYPYYYWNYYPGQPVYPYDVQRYSRPNFPEVNPTQLKKSAESFKPLMHEVDKIIHEFTDSDDFAYKVLDAAQRSQTEKIHQYMEEIGITHPMEINYNPDSLQLKLINQVDDMDSSILRVSLHW